MQSYGTIAAIIAGVAYRLLTLSYRILKERREEKRIEKSRREFGAQSPLRMFGHGPAGLFPFSV